MDLSVAQAAALINVAVVVLTLSFPLVITLVTVGSLKKNVNAATWSVFGRLINQSLWPNLLGTDAAGVKKVDKRIRSLSLLATVGAVLLAFASAITPLGLHDDVILKEAEDVTFLYARDISPIGMGTPSRSGYSLNRVCGEYTSCPGNHDPYRIINDTLKISSNGTISTSIAANITEVFTSATKNSRTISSVLDIQYRDYTNFNDDREWLANLTTFRDHGKARTQGRFRFYHDLIVDSRTQAIEGLIVSTGETPDVGFRNHTLPPSSDLGYSWTEDLLWLEPDTTCTNLNITFEYELPLPGYSSPFIKGSLVDRGGFVNLASEKFLNMMLYTNRTNTQDDPRLLQKSWKAASLTNAIILNVFNQTVSASNQSFVGEKYPLDKYLTFSGDENVDPRRISYNTFGSWFSPSNDSKIGSYYPSLPSPMDYVLLSPNRSSSVKGSQGDIGAYVLAWDRDIGHIDIAGMGGGLMLAAGTQIDDNGQAIPWGASIASPGSKWSRPIYSCVSAVKASVKTVEFQLKGTSTLKQLDFKRISDKQYQSEQHWPIWAVEKTPTDPSGIEEGTGISPFWGIVSDKASKLPGITTIRRPYLYLPLPGSTFGYFDAPNAEDSVAGANVPIEFLGQIYDGFTFQNAAPELLKSNDWRLLKRWAQLSNSAATAGKIVDLMWTDLVANTLVGTKSTLSGPLGETSRDSAMMPAQAYESGLAYDWRFAIAALVFAGLFATLLAWSFILFCTRKLSFAILRFMLNQSSAGRSMTTERYKAGDEVDFSSTMKWAKTRGGEVLRVTVTDADRRGEKSAAYTLVTPEAESQSSLSIRSR